MLQLDKLGKIAVESTIDNVYVKIPEKEMSVSSILSSIAERKKSTKGADASVDFS